MVAADDGRSLRMQHLSRELNQAPTWPFHARALKHKEQQVQGPRSKVVACLHWRDSLEARVARAQRG